MNNIFKYSDNNKRYHTLDYFYKHKFNSKVFKVSLNAGLSCPNIDGTVGKGGCIYCSNSGSGEFAGNKNDDIIINIIILTLKNNLIYLKYLFIEKILNFLFLYLWFIIKYIINIKIYKKTILIFKYSPHNIPII